MSCGCKDKNKQPEPVTPQVTPPAAPEVKYHRLGIHCYCGLYRLIPEGLKFGETFILVPCPKCGSGFHGRLIDETLVEGLDMPVSNNPPADFAKIG